MKAMSVQTHCLPPCSYAMRKEGKQIENIGGNQCYHHSAITTQSHNLKHTKESIFSILFTDMKKITKFFCFIVIATFSVFNPQGILQALFVAHRALHTPRPWQCL